LVYSVCSFEPEEGLDHVTWLEKDYRDQIEVVSPTIALPDYFKRYVTRENVLMIYSGNQDDMEGFTSFVVRKKG
jgi:16S rRNA (cytosine967-C5)-methyltransferase